MSKIELGDEVRDTITGFKGIVIGKAEYMWGCVQYGIQSQELHEGKPNSVLWPDQDRLEVVKTKVSTLPEPIKATGGRSRNRTDGLHRTKICKRTKKDGNLEKAIWG